MLHIVPKMADCHVVTTQLVKLTLNTMKSLPKVQYNLLRCTFELAASRAITGNNFRNQLQKETSSSWQFRIFDNGDHFACVEYRKYPGGICKKALSSIPVSVIEEWEKRIDLGDASIWKASNHNLRDFCG